MILDVFEYNQHFVAMMNIINKARIFNKEGKFEKHHIIPRCYFRKMKIPVDNSAENLVKLTTEEHRQVHKLASLCCIKAIYPALKLCCNLMNRERITGENNPNFGRKHTEEERQRMSEKVKLAYKEGRIDVSGENNGMYGKTPWNKGKRTIKEKPKKNPPGVHKCNEETRRKISEAKKEWWKTHKNTWQDKCTKARTGKKRGKYKLSYTTWKIDENGKRIYY